MHYLFSKCIVTKGSILEVDTREEIIESLEVFTRKFYILEMSNSLPVTSPPLCPLGLKLNMEGDPTEGHNSYQVHHHRNILSPLVFIELNSK